MKPLSLRLIEGGAWCYLIFAVGILIFTLSSGTPINKLKIGYGDDGMFHYFVFSKETSRIQDARDFLTQTEIESTLSPSDSILHTNPNLFKLVMSIFWLCTIILTYLIISSIRSIYASGLFQSGLLRNLNILFWGFISLYLYKNLIIPVLITFVSGQPTQLNIGIDGQWMLWFLLLAFFVSAIKEGVELKTENDLTI